MITQEEVCRRFNYEPESGYLVWKWQDDRPNNINGRFAGQIAGSPCNHGLHVSIMGRTYLAHRLIWLYVHGYMPEYIDHRNGNNIDNRLTNLRPCSPAQNAANVYKLDRGISKQRRKYRARIGISGVNLSLGYFDTREEAQAAYHAAADKYFGEFARINR
jgi:hypothetical protein